MADGEERQSWEQGKGGFIVLFLSPLSLFIYDTSGMTRATVRPQGQCAACSTLVTVTTKADLTECFGSLADHKTIAPLPITPRESAGSKFWVNEGLHARLDHEG